jgi:hypothetical protein
MALDYSKLTDEELEAIANNDYAKLSDTTLQMLANESPPVATPNPLTTVETSLADPIEGMATGAAIKGAFGSPERLATSSVGPYGPVKPTVTPAGPISRVAGEVADLAKIAGKISPSMINEQVIQKPLTFLSQVPGAFAERYLGSANMNKTFGEMAKGAGQALMNPANYKNIATGAGAMALAPENMLAAPYQMAAYEQEKIRANPNAPEYATTPYAQQYRGEYATQGQAGAANRRSAVAGQQYGGLTAEERRILEQDQIDQAIRRKAAQKVLGPIAPGR